MRAPRRTVRTASLTALAVAIVVGAGADRAGAMGGDWTLLDGTNAARVEAGVGPLAPADDLDAVAMGQAQAMAERGSLFHNPDLATQVRGWSAVGENVGVGFDLAAIHGMFLASPPHRANILDARFTELGVGVATTADGRLWVAEVFRQPMAAASPSAPASMVTTTTVALVPAAPRPTRAPRKAPPAPPPPVVAAPVAAEPTASPAPPEPEPLPSTAQIDLTPDPPAIELTSARLVASDTASHDGDRSRTVAGAVAGMLPLLLAARRLLLQRS